MLVTITAADGTPIRMLTASAAAGIHRTTWDLRLPGISLARPANPEADEDFFGPPRGGPYVAPGKYAVQLAKRVDGVVTPLAGPVEFTVKYVGPEPPSAADVKELAAFQKQVVVLERDLNAALAVAGEFEYCAWTR